MPDLPPTTGTRPGGQRRELTGWGRAVSSGADVVAPLSADEVRNLLDDPPSRGVLARGLGRSYGDAAQNAGGAVLDATSLTGITSFDADSGRLVAQAGLGLDDLLRWVVPRGWFPAVTPGTRFVTLGGAVAADIHGKNHHRDGTFTASVDRMTLETPAGTRRVDRDGLEDEAELFWATAGGMGLTGVITDLELRLTSVGTSSVRMDTERVDDLDQLMAAMDAGDHRYRYSVAWIDTLATGASLGRGVLTRGDHAEVDDLPVARRARPLAYDPTQPLAAPSWVPTGMINRMSVRAFNELWFRKAPRHREGEIQSIPAFFHPLDGVKDWNRLYGRRGFIQYQFVVPFGQETVLTRIVETLARRRVVAALGVLKRFGEANPGPLSFPIPGWTLALDLPVGDPGLAGLLDRFDELVAGAGGRVYLAKDSRMRPATFEAMYPRLEQWRAVRDRVDPDRVMRSDLSRRLGI